jgi:hypothetical protein
MKRKVIFLFLMSVLLVMPTAALARGGGHGGHSGGHHSCHLSRKHSLASHHTCHTGDGKEVPCTDVSGRNSKEPELARHTIKAQE